MALLTKFLYLKDVDYALGNAAKASLLIIVLSNIYKLYMYDSDFRTKFP